MKHSFHQTPKFMNHCTVAHQKITLNQVTFDWREINDLISELRAARLQAYLNENLVPFCCEKIQGMKQEGKSNLEIVKWVRQNTKLDLNESLTLVRGILAEDIGDSR